MATPRVQLIHWKASEAPPRIEKLKKAGFRPVYQELTQESYRQLRKNPPDAFVIDLTRLPSHGREVGLFLRSAKTSRHIPLVFVEGDPAKVQRIREVLPDAVYTNWGRIKGAVKRAIAHPPKAPVVPSSQMAGYSGTPLPKKLGIKQGAVIALVGAPKDFQKTLGTLPKDVTVRNGARGRRDLTIWFVKRLADLETRIDSLADAVGEGALWIAWPKQASGVDTDVTGNDVRKIGLASGLVDYKVCAIDPTWSGLKFARRKA